MTGFAVANGLFDIFFKKITEIMTLSKTLWQVYLENKIIFVPLQTRNKDGSS